MNHTGSRVRSERLTLRLTADEKKLLTKRAKKKAMTVTDYIIASISAPSEKSGYADLLRLLRKIDSTLEALNTDANKEAVFEALEQNRNVYDKVLLAVSRG